MNNGKGKKTITRMMEGQDNTLIWFSESQLQLVIRNGVVPEWFHGIISRKTSEELLMPKPPGYFLIRVSESRIGYTLSYRAKDRCRHFMISALEDGHYFILGENRRHKSLQNLVDFHRRTPIMPFSEVLTVACGQTSNEHTDYAELLFPRRRVNTNNSLHASASHPTTQEDIPPAVPYRPNSLLNFPDKLYPSLEGFPRVASPPSPTFYDVQTKTRKRDAAEKAPPKQPPEVPVRSFVPPLKQNQVCIRTVSAASELQNQEEKLAVASNPENLLQKLQPQKTSMSQECMYAEINVETTRRGGDSQQPFRVQPFSYTYTDVSPTDGGLHHEYLPPPPFAPGY